MSTGQEVPQDIPIQSAPDDPQILGAKRGNLNPDSNKALMGVNELLDQLNDPELRALIESRIKAVEESVEALDLDPAKQEKLITFLYPYLSIDTRIKGKDGDRLLRGLVSEVVGMYLLAQDEIDIATITNSEFQPQSRLSQRAQFKLREFVAKTEGLGPFPIEVSSYAIPRGAIEEYKGPDSGGSDRVLEMPENGVYAVFDGVSTGSHPQGPSVARETFGDYIRNQMGLLCPLSDEEAFSILDGAHINTTKKVANEHVGMTAYCAVVFGRESGNDFFGVIHAGDVRLLAIVEGKVAFQTLDHSEPLSGLSEDEALRVQSNASKSDWTEEELSQDPELRKYIDGMNTIYAALGKVNQGATYDAKILKNGVTLVLASDGVHSVLTQAEIVESISAGATAEDLVKAAALKKGPRQKDDDRSAIVIRYGSRDRELVAPKDTVIGR